MMRTVAATVLSFVSGISGIMILGVAMLGCAQRAQPGEREVASPATLTAAPVVREAVAPVAPAAATAQPERRTRLRQTLSLGNAGDGPLTQIRPHDRLWYEEDGYPMTYAAWGYGGGYGYGNGGAHGRATAAAGGATQGGVNIINGTQFAASASAPRASGGRPIGARPSGNPRAPR